MKTTFKLIGAVATVAALFSSCKKEAFNEEVKPGTVEMTIIAGADDATRTVLGSDGAVTWSAKGETLKVLENNGASNLSSYTSEEGVSNDERKTMSFAVSLDRKTAETFDYFALYPSTSFVEDTYSDAKRVKVILPAQQSPSATSFDPKSDILVSKPVLGLAEQPTSLELQFARVVAIGKMNITKLNTEEKVKKVSFTATGKVVNGRSYINLEDASAVQYGYYAKSATVTLDYTEQSIAANEMTAYFTCWPFELAAGDTFSVVVETENYIFTKDVTLAKGRSLAFNVGSASAFSVNFEGIKGVKTTTDVTSAKLTAEDFINAGALASYKLVTVTQDNGLSWDCYAYLSTDNFIQVRNCKQNDATKNDSYIKLPSFSKDIRSVTVKLGKVSTEGASIFLSSTKDATAADLSSLTASSELSYTFDLAGKGITTAYLRCYGSTLYVESVEVIVGEDTRTVLTTPKVSASLNKKDPNVTNSIDVMWNAVENAGSYVVTATPAKGKAKSETVNAGTETTTYSHTITDLAYETEYTISVVAKPSDTTLYRESEAGVADDKVTTGAGEEVLNTYTSTFTDKSFATIENNGITWTASIEAAAFESASPSRGVQFGAAKGKFTITGKGVSGSIKKITMIVSTNGTTNANTIDVKIGDSTIGSQVKLTKNNNYEISFESTIALKGDIVISVNDTKKSVYFKSITINPAN